MTPSPTPRSVYEPRIFAVRLLIDGGPIAGIGFKFKAPYGTSIMASEILARAVARQQISGYSFRAVSKTAFRRLDRAGLRRFDEAFAAVGEQLGIDWAA